MTYSAVLTLFFFTAATPPAMPAPSFSGQFELLLVSDSIWGHCDMSISVTESGAGELANACRVYDGPVRRKARKLQIGEVAELRALLRQADLFGKVSPGTDHRGIDLPLITLKATTGDRTTDLVCFRNPDFEREGPRKRLLDKLMAWYRETRNA